MEQGGLLICKTDSHKENILLKVVTYEFGGMDFRFQFLRETYVIFLEMYWYWT
jgi:hypothetical protein